MKNLRRLTKIKVDHVKDDEGQLWILLFMESDPPAKDADIKLSNADALNLARAILSVASEF